MYRDKLQQLCYSMEIDRPIYITMEEGPEHDAEKFCGVERCWCCLQSDLKERLKRAYTALKKDFRQIFEKLDPRFEQLADDEKNKAYDPKWVKKSLELQEPDGAVEKVMLSFAWREV